MKKILVLEDEPSIRSFVVINLRRSGYEPIEAATGEEAMERIRQHPDILVALLDVMLPDIDGFEVCRRIRATGSKMGIIMLSAKSQEMDKITGLMTGADDYVTKPFSPAELTARVDALYRRIGGGDNAEDALSSGPFLLHLHSRTLDKNGEHIRLTQTEFTIMKLFMNNPGRALSREEMGEITMLLASDLIKRAKTQLGIDLKITAALRNHIVDEYADDKMGARPLKRAIQSVIEDPLSEKILAEEFTAGCTVTAGFRGGEVTLTKKKKGVKKEALKEA